jgi:hypothetical protein
VKDSPKARGPGAGQRRSHSLDGWLRAGCDAAAVSAVAEIAAGVLSPEELELVTIELAGDDGQAIRIRGESELVDRVERALYPDDAPDGPAPVASVAAEMSSPSR